MGGLPSPTWPAGKAFLWPESSPIRGQIECASVMYGAA